MAFFVDVLAVRGGGGAEAVDHAREKKCYDSNELEMEAHGGVLRLACSGGWGKSELGSML